MKNLILILNFVFLSALSSMAQSNNVYYSRDVKMQLTGEYKNELFQAWSTSLNVVLDYETTDIILRLPLNSLKTDVDSLNKLLKRSATEVVFKGRLSLEYINTHEHPPLSFGIKGEMLINNSRLNIEGEGELHHVDDVGEVACMLGLVIPLNLQELDIDLGIPGFEDDFEVKITQAVLRQDKN